MQTEQLLPADPGSRRFDPGFGRPPAGRRRASGRARRIRFAVWIVLLVTFLCLVASIASPARNGGHGPSASAAAAAATRVSAPGTPTTAPMPPLIGRRLPAAETLLASTGLEPFLRIKDRVSGKPAGRILFQRPWVGTDLRPGQRVTLIVARPIPR
jgi:hypothetical protein